MGAAEEIEKREGGREGGRKNKRKGGKEEWERWSKKIWSESRQKQEHKRKRKTLKENVSIKCG